MKTRSITLIAILCFSLPVITEAEIQNNTAKRDAEKDAKFRNQLGWFAGGCVGSAFPWIVLIALLGTETVDSIAPLSPIRSFPTIKVGWDSFCLSGIVLGALSPTAYAIFRSPVPPADRFLGQSPDYIDTYTTTYKKRVREQRFQLSAVGCLAGTCFGVSLGKSLMGCIAGADPE